MIKTNNLYFGRIWSIQEYLGKGNYSISLLENKYKLLYLTKHVFYISKIDAFKDIETGKYYPINLEAVSYEKFFINLKDIKSISDAFPTSKNNEEIELNVVNDLKNKVLTKKYFIHR